jgi:hypothetical protein
MAWSVMQQAGRLVGAPVCVDVGTALEQEAHDFEVMMSNG